MVIFLDFPENFAERTGTGFLSVHFDDLHRSKMTPPEGFPPRSENSIRLPFSRVVGRVPAPFGLGRIDKFCFDEPRVSHDTPRCGRPRGEYTRLPVCTRNRQSDGRVFI